MKFYINKSKLAVCCLLTLVSSVVLAQDCKLTTLDEHNHVIEKVQIVNEAGKTVGLTNAKGVAVLKNTNPSQIYTLRRVGYESMEISALKSDRTVVLKTKSLSEVSIVVNKEDERRELGEEVIDKCELGKLACCNLAESLENTNAVDVNFSDGITGGREIQMLALAGTYSQQLGEGIPYHRGILNKVGLELIPGPWVESIGITNGIGSVINGYDNISGVLNVEFPRPHKSQDWFVNGYVSEIGKSDFNVVKGFKLADNLHTNVLAHTSFSRVTMDNNNDKFTDMPTFLNINLMNKWRYLNDKGFRFSALIQAAMVDKEAGQIHNNEIIANPYIINQNYRSFHAQFKTGWEVNEEKESSFAVLYKFNYGSQTGFVGNRMIDDDQYYLNISPTFHTNLSESSSKLKIGMQILYNKERESLGNLNFQKKEFVNGAFAEWTSKTDNLTTILGFRGDYHNELGFFASPRATLMFRPSEYHLLKFNGGFGFKTPTILTDAFGYLVSNRQVIMPNELQAEKAFNGGLSYKLDYSLFGMGGTFEAGYYLTLFQNQLIMNIESPELLKIEYLKDDSRAQSFQINNNIDLTDNLSLRLAYKNDQAIINYDGEQKIRPLMKTDKFLANLYWTSNNSMWRFSTTLLVNGRARIPEMTFSQEEYSPFYPILHAQVNFVPNDKMDFYIGSENIFSYSQYDRIQSFTNPSASSFDAGMIWGPMDIRRTYIGGKITF